MYLNLKAIWNALSQTSVPLNIMAIYSTPSLSSLVLPSGQLLALLNIVLDGHTLHQGLIVLEVPSQDVELRLGLGGSTLVVVDPGTENVPRGTSRQILHKKDLVMCFVDFWTLFKEVEEALGGILNPSKPSPRYYAKK